jgi:hypothetical protein
VAERWGQGTSHRGTVDCQEGQRGREAAREVTEVLGSVGKRAGEPRHQGRVARDRDPDLGPPLEAPCHPHPSRTFKLTFCPRLCVVSCRCGALEAANVELKKEHNALLAAQAKLSKAAAKC